MELFENDIKDIEKNRISFYLACLEEFSQFGYSDPYIEQIKKDLELLKTKFSYQDS
ncbi:hypothetical protein [Pseudoalteromonas sp.]|uniref:hypothetical protein n=1 Tax=Pseudoalteromonas sp. TaxID=53249 RepID=UPI0035644CAE